MWNVNKMNSKLASPKFQARLWSEITEGLTLEEGLSRLTKEELDKLRQKLGVRNASSLKKPELIERLCEAVPELLHKQWMRIDSHRYELLARAASRNGVLGAEQIGVSEAAYYQQQGWLFPGTLDGRRVLIMPLELRESVKGLNILELKQQLKRNDQWLKLTYGLLYYYGLVKKGKLMELIRDYMKEPLQELAYLETILESLDYVPQFQPTSLGWAHWRLVEEEHLQAILKEQESRPSLGYCELPKERVLQAAEFDYVETTPEFNAFAQYIRSNYTLTAEEAHEIVLSCVWRIQEGAEFNEIMSFVQSMIEMEDVQTLDEVMAFLVAIFNSTRQWALKGHTPNEIAARSGNVLRSPVPAQPAGEVFSLESRKKVGRNDPCPCGSGKKFKKCCSA